MSVTTGTAFSGCCVVRANARFRFFRCRRWKKIQYLLQFVRKRTLYLTHIHLLINSHIACFKYKHNMNISGVTYGWNITTQWRENLLSAYVLWIWVQIFIKIAYQDVLESMKTKNEQSEHKYIWCSWHLMHGRKVPAIWVGNERNTFFQ
jgi:hypothetical protein